MDLTSQSLQNQLLVVLRSTLHHDSVKIAQQKLETLSLHQGYSIGLLKIMCSGEREIEVRSAAAIALKNFVRTNWSGEGDAPLPDSEREELRSALLDHMFSMPTSLQFQCSEVVFQISRFDFPSKWPRLAEIIRSKIAVDINSADVNFEHLSISLNTLDQLVNRYRHEMRSDSLWLEIIYVVGMVAEPLTLLWTQIVERIRNAITSNNWTTNSVNSDGQKEIGCLVGIVLSLVRIYHSLIAQDIPPHFEDNLPPWMQGFLMLLQLQYPIDIDRSVCSDHEPSNLERLKTEICEVATLFSQRFEDIFSEFTRGFIETVWQQLEFADSRIRFDSFVNAALCFLAAICQRPHYAKIFEEPDVLRRLCVQVVIKNLLLRTEDLEIYENEPFEFLKRDIEGSDLETRRRGATDFVRALCRLFERQIFEVLSGAIVTFLEEYAIDPIGQFAKKDVVYFLVSAMAARGSTTRYGSTTTSQLINVSDFFIQHVRTDLIDGGPDERPILRGDALKYLILFRRQLNPELILECIAGPGGDFAGRSIVRLLSSRFTILHHYVAYTLERLFLLTSSTSPLQISSTQTSSPASVPLISSTNVPLGAIIETIFNCFRISPGAGETHYIMKALMRAFTLVDEQWATTFASKYVDEMAQMIEQSVRVPKNPLLIHFIFESICVLSQKAYSGAASGGVGDTLANHVIRMAELIIANDIADFTAYAFQLIAVLLDQSDVLRKRGMPVNQEQYKTFFPALLRPQFWGRSANFPALIRVFESFIRCMPNIVFASEESDQLLGIIQRLISSKANDQHGFRLANACIPHMDKFDGGKITSRDLLLTMLSRLNQSKTFKCSRQFALFVCRYSALKSGAELAGVLNAIQDGLFSMVIEKLIIPEIREMPLASTLDEKRTAAIGFSSLIVGTVSLLDGSLYGQLVEVVVSMLESFRAQPLTTINGATTNQQHLKQDDAASLFSSSSEKDNDEGQSELEYRDPYCKLSFAQHVDHFFPEVTNVKSHFAQAVLVTSSSASTQNLNCIPDRIKDCLNSYLI